MYVPCVNQDKSMKIQHIICILCIGLGVLLCTNLFLQFQQSERLPSLTLYYGIGICRYIVSTFQKRSRTSASNRSSFQRIWHRNLSVQFQQSEKLQCFPFYSGISIWHVVSTFQKRSRSSTFQRIWHRNLSVQFQQSERLPCLTFYSDIGICHKVLTLQKRYQHCAFQRVGHQDLSGYTKISIMSKRKLLSEMSKRYYHRLKCNARNITIAENMNKLSTDFAKVHDVQNSSDIIEHVITDVNYELDQATNVALRNEPPRQYCNVPDNENIAYHLDYNSNLNLEDLCPIAFTFNNKKNADCTSSSTAATIRQDLTNWAVQFQISHTAVTALLSILRNHGFDNLPKNSKTMLKTPKYTNVRRVTPGEYFHNGLRSGIMQFLQKSQDDVDSVSVQISIDGLPISKSSTNQLWPILGSVRPKLSDIFIIGCYYGSKKPYDCNEFLRDFVDEAKILAEGLEYKGKSICVSIDSLIADAPAKSFVTATKGHTGYFSCPKCTTEGEYISGRMYFPDINCTSRTNESFLIQRQIEHHTGSSILSDIPNFGMISHIPLDYMHLVCIGVVKKILNFWLSGPLNVRLPAQLISSISRLSIEMRSSIPVEFARRPRELNFLSLWKATEFRLFLLYTGPIVLKNYMKKDVYNNFLTLHVAIRLLCSPDLLHITYAESLLQHFVQSFIILYGLHYASYNIHALIHLAEDVRKFGPLDTFSNKIQK